MNLRESRTYEIAERMRELDIRDSRMHERDGCTRDQDVGESRMGRELSAVFVSQVALTHWSCGGADGCCHFVAAMQPESARNLLLLNCIGTYAAAMQAECTWHLLLLTRVGTYVAATQAESARHLLLRTHIGYYARKKENKKSARKKT